MEQSCIRIFASFYKIKVKIFMIFFQFSIRDSLLFETVFNWRVYGTLKNILFCFYSSNNDSFRSTSRPKSKSSVFQEQRLARISILIVWLFLFCHVWKLVPTAFEASYSHDGLTHSNWPHWVLIVENMSHLLIALNSSINFLIYIVM